MKRTLRLALGQINNTVGDLQGNGQKIAAIIGQAREVDADLVAFPELAISGYPPEDLRGCPGKGERSRSRHAFGVFFSREPGRCQGSG